MVGDNVSTKRKSHKRKLSRSRLAERRCLELRGVCGALAAFLNDGPGEWMLAAQDRRVLRSPGLGELLIPRPPIHRQPLPKALRDWLRDLARSPSSPRLPVSRGQIVIPRGSGRILHYLFNQGGWEAVRYVLLRRPWFTHFLGNERSEDVWRMAIEETVVFAAAGFEIAGCEHGRHLYVRRDKREKNCLRHRGAAAQARWRKWRKEHPTHTARHKAC